MSQFTSFSEINSSVLTIDGGDLTRGPLPRWKKRLESSVASLNGSLNNTTAARSILSMSYNTSINTLNNVSSLKTPGKGNGNDHLNNNNHNNNNTINTRSKRVAATPSKAPPKTPAPNTGGGDRFIPNRGATNFELGHFLIKHDPDKSSLRTEDGSLCSGADGGLGAENNNTQNGTMGGTGTGTTATTINNTTSSNGISSGTMNGIDSNSSGLMTPSRHEHRKLISESLQLTENPRATRILSYQQQRQTTTSGANEINSNPLKVIYSASSGRMPMAAKTTGRYIPSAPDRILDAPDIINDYYLNLLDWSVENIVTVALGNCVYLWNSVTGSIEQLVEYEEGDHACALAWIEEGEILAIGNNTGAVELWDCSKLKRLRVMNGHSARVGTLAWNSFIISSGSRDGTIVHHDVRVRQHHVASLSGHAEEVCGLKWSTDFKYLASGGNDNLVNIWPAVGGGGIGTGSEPLHVFNQHQAAVRALAWCPWQPSLLATGGGTVDRCIKFWNVNSGTLINSMDSKSQVCVLMWSRHYKEIMSAHGYPNNQLTIWKYPTMTKQTDLSGHTARVLQLAMSPDGSTVVSAGADETLRLWNCFAPDSNAMKKELTASTSRTPKSVFRTCLR